MRRLFTILLTVIAAALIVIGSSQEVRGKQQCFQRTPRIDRPEWVNKIPSSQTFSRWLDERRGIYFTVEDSLIGPYMWVREADNKCPGQMPLKIITAIKPELNHGNNIEAHHIIEERFAEQFNFDKDKLDLVRNNDSNMMPAVLLTVEEHDNVTGKLLRNLKVGQSHSQADILAVYQHEYKFHHDWLDAINATLAPVNTFTQDAPPSTPVPLRLPTFGQGCQCPYDYAADGSQCGFRSAYNQIGGNKPTCY